MQQSGASMLVDTDIAPLGISNKYHITTCQVCSKQAEQAVWTFLNILNNSS